MTEEKIQKLEFELFQVRYELAVIKKLLIPDKTPDWALLSKDIAYSAGLRPSPYGEGYDMCRLLELLCKVGILSKEGH
ncbi:hypothetical protein PGN04_29350 [Klebsiella quasipneumoniae subsp. quasipneumoniae]|uniref:hypothetical protein n=1 Tax=Klebsiella quasipneumoniae TaxID=1463165 RepID=UPI0022F104FA|nr:hypothetical protein [Klebsiella quasipneumoniae]MDA5091912.1 hypothetical protein [Klebsiella quasipneumoniae subsp. quasipneumoniae]